MAEANGFLPVYLANGDDTLKRERVAERLHGRIARLGDLSFNSEEFDGESARGADIVAACNTLPFMSDVRLVTVKNADKLRKADAEALVDYLEAPADTAVLALYAQGLAKNTRLYKAVAKFGKTAVIDCASVAKRDLPSLIAKMAKGHGITMRSDAVSLLIDLVGEDTVRIDAELRKLSLSHEGAGAVTVDEVNRLVGRTTEAKPWEFVDAFSERDAAKCLRLRARMESSSPYALLAMCITRVRELAMVRGLMARGQQSQMTKLIKGPAWKVEKFYPRYARNFTADELRAALKSARDAERAMKSGADPETAFETWYLSVVARAGRG
ncbi:MAG: DNA polymerase III subunit delta [Coriobacteriaceae bacterium]|nr:DNA polymerase III subunit delta [Coriobacteriaceae bacterium]